MSSNDLTAKQRLAIDSTRMPEQPPERRVKNFEEVNLGLEASAAIEEARRQHRNSIEDFGGRQRLDRHAGCGEAVGLSDDPAR